MATPVPEVTDSPPERKNRLHILDGLRFLAALMVMSFHYIEGAPGSWGMEVDELFGPTLTHVSSYGFLGVQLFFIISGFVICMSSWGRSLPDFIISRVTRLMPAYVFCVLLTSLVITLLPAEAGKAPDLNQILVNLTMLQDFVGVPHVDAVYWTLVVEFKFYLLFTIVVYKGVTYRRVLAFCWLWTIGSLILTHSPFSVMNDVMIPSSSHFFVAGIAIYLIHRFGANLLLWMLLGISWVISLRGLYPTVEQLAKNGSPISWPGTMIMVTCFYLLMLGVSMGAFSWVRWRGLTVVGALTYPLYLLHHMIGRSVIRTYHEVHLIG